MKVFISYSHEDRQIARNLIEGLSPYHDCWIDSDDIRGGDNWQKSIDSAIARCDVFLFLASWQSLESSHCQHEVEVALRRRKKIIPIVLVNPIVMRSELSALQWIFWEPDGITALVGELQPSGSKWWKFTALVESLLIIIMAALLVSSR